MTHAGKMSRNEHIFKNEFFLFSPLKHLQNDIRLVGIGQKKMTELQPFEGNERVSRSDLEKIRVKDCKAKSPINIAYFPPILFLLIITILLITI